MTNRKSDKLKSHKIEIKMKIIGCVKKNDAFSAPVEYSVNCVLNYKRKRIKLKNMYKMLEIGCQD